MAGQEHMFRKAALDKLSSPERLDVMMQITSPAGWLALTALGFVVFLIIVWSIFGWIPIKVNGQGILIRGGAVLAVTAETQGRLNQVTISPGDVIQRGQIIARVGQDELLSRIENQKALLLDAQRSSGVGNNAGMIAALQQKAAQQQELVNRGLLTRTSLLATQQQIASLQQQGVGQQSQIEQIKRNIKDLEAQALSASQVTSPYNGRVIEVVANVGDLIGPGARLVTLEELNAPIDTMLYIPAAEGKKVQPGMEVRVSPSTVKAEEYGFMIGRVTKVSDYPVTPEGLQRVLRNDALAQTLASAGAPIEVKVQLIPDSSTPSGFKWSSSKGPPIKVASGTLCSGAVVVQKKRPLSYVLPIFKSAIGG